MSDARAAAVAATTSHAALCTACGLCCDGSLFNAVRLAPAEIAPLSELGMRIEPGEIAQFNQPCNKLVDRTCSIYANRPGTCRAFACALLRKVRCGDVGLEAALQVVATARTLRDKAATAMPADTGAAAWFATDPNATWNHIEDPDARRAAALRHLDQVVLQKYLTTHFRTANDRP